AEDAVRKSVSARVDEALAQNVVDLQANDVPDLAAKMDGRTAKTAAGDVVLATKAAPIEDDALNPIESLLHLVVDPQIAVLLFPPFRPTFPGVRATVDPAIIAVVVAVTAGFFVFLVRMAARLLRQPGLVPVPLLA